MRMRSRPGSLVLLSVTLAVQTGQLRRADAQAPSLPADHQGADLHLQRGYELLTRGQDLAALDAFERAHELAPSPTALVLIATAEQALGRWADADRHLAEALRATDDPYIEAQRPLLLQMQASAKRHLGETLVATAQLAPADVQRDIDVQRSAPKEQRRTPSSPGRTVGSIGVGLGALGLTVGGMALVVRHTAQAKFDSSNCTTAPGVADYGGGRCKTLHDTSSTAGTWAKIGLGAGGAFLLTGLLVLVVTAADEPASRSSVACGIAGSSLACAGRF
jgi:hypothetical protein